MSRYTGPKEKLSRSLGENLGLKAERSFSPKSAFLRKPYRPGIHKKRRRVLSEFGIQLAEKQKLKFTYGFTERQLENYFKKARREKYGVLSEVLLKTLEKRLDNVIFRAGFAGSRPAARQMTGHGHFLVNGRRTSVPSLEVKPKDTIGIRPGSLKKQTFSDLAAKLKKSSAPSWLEVNKKNFEISVKTEPQAEDLPKNFNMNAVISYYSK